MLKFFSFLHIAGHLTSTILGIVIAVTVTAICFLLVYLGKATVSEITPILSFFLPVVIPFLLYGQPQNDKPNV